MTKPMTYSLMKWHLARDNQEQLARFCDKYQVAREISDFYHLPDTDGTYYTMTTYFDNGGFIEAELRRGDHRSYSVADYYQVINYQWGKIS